MTEKNERAKGREKVLMHILTADKATAQEQYAASELRHYLNLMSACSISIVTEGKEADPARVTRAMLEESAPQAVNTFIAIGQAASTLGVRFDTSLGDDAFTIKTVGQSIAIVGGKRGIIYGVYELLEQMGCRFFTPQCEKIPCVASLLPLPKLDLTQKPVLEYRMHNYKDLTAFPRFAVKSRVNGSANIPEDMGGSIQYAWFVHSFEREIISPDEYFDEHPEYFSMVDGKRLREFSQLCLTNPDVLRITVEKVRAALRAKPHCRMISISPNDWYNLCTCPKCAEIDKREESNAGSLIWFVNQVGEQIEEEFPDVIIDTLAYQYCRQAPKSLRPRRNVCVRLCSIESCFSHPFETCDDDRRTKRPDGSLSSFMEDLTAWSKVCDRLYIWDYTTGFAHYPAPHANWGVLQPNMQTFVKHNVKGVFEQACGAIGGSTDLNELRAYLITKLMWNADCDIEQHKREFCEAFYGKAAEYVLAYIDELTDKVNRDNIHTGFNNNCDKPYLTNECLGVYEGLFNKAEKAVANDPIRLMRVAKAKLSFRWVRMKNKQMLENKIDPQEVNQFFEDWRAHGLTRIDEWVSAETSLRAFLDGKWRGVVYYHHWTDEGPERL